ncbi:glycoside hydrolase family 3 C-terminal domain-containing protein [Planobispora longispora]|uniref:Glycosyl hydrolase n=1 Tax=Planobispora longispora TaxID=28887 RepID=A0A8J3RQ24_9ACTN|nr:glycoside hydrolase family 3 C-terminal domain-containing protein [Planobispora longispora]GIH79702.1 glycosyl hydrolase [Planobispora longispora]
MSADKFDRLVDELSLEQKVRLLTGATVWRLRDEPAIGLRAMVASDGPVGVRGEGWDERNTSLTLPSATAMAATWDEDLVELLGGLIAAEARRKGVHLVLAPTLNLHRSPLGGRHFECYSEDPLLTGRVGAAYIRGVQAGGVAATAKHYVANDSETERLTLDARVDEQTLRELYMAPFEAAVEAGVWAVMSAYNGVNGATMSESPLLAEPLKGEWGFDGVVVSDWGGVRSTVPSARAAQDLAMPGPNPLWEENLVAAVRAGEVPEAAIDDKVRRLLRLADRVGALDPGSPDGPAAPLSGGSSAEAVTAAPSPGTSASSSSAAPSPGTSASSSSAASSPGSSASSSSAPLAPEELDAARALLRRSVAAGTVLLRNEGGLLPMDPARLRRIAVIGPNAAAARIQGGGSAGVYPVSTVSPLDGLREALAGAAEVIYSPGVHLDSRPTPLDTGNARNPRTGEPGLLVRLLDASGAEVHAEHRLTGRLPEPGRAASAVAVEIRALLRPGADGPWDISFAGWGRVQLEVNGLLRIDEKVLLDTDDPATVHLTPPCRRVRLSLTAGREVELVARRHFAPGTGVASILAADPVRQDGPDALAAAVELARTCDLAVVVVGTTEEIESEGFDREHLDLPGRQNELVRAVAAACPDTVVVVNSGGPVVMPWHEEVPAVLLSWFPGQEAGHGLADVLLGAAEPGGRLPTTWSESALFSTVPEDGVLTYGEGLDIGYRAWLREPAAPAYWFGHGLGYASWSYEGLSVPRRVAPGAPLTVRVRLRNTGRRAGREVVQVYLSRPETEVTRPVRWLAGFAPAVAEPGGTVEVEVGVPARAFQHWSAERHAWCTEEGAFTLLAGRSSVDLPLSATVFAGADVGADVLVEP